MDHRLAIVGVSARFAGAPDVHTYWDDMLAVRRRFGVVPRSRWDHARFFDPDDPRSVHRAYSDRGAFISDIEHFAAQHYRLPPNRVHAMDPQHRLLLDAARAAWIDAGFERRNPDRSSIGVFVGMSSADYRELSLARVRAQQMLTDGARGQQPDGSSLTDELARIASSTRPFHAFTMPGCLQNMAPALVSSVLDLRGPSFAVDAACSSSLVALHQASAAVRSGQCSAALVGGVYLNLVPDAMVGFSRIGALSRSGVCRPFDGEADGFVIGEGAGMVVIKRLDDALSDGDDIYAVIRGSGSSNDGRAEGPMTPTVDGQLIAMRRAYEDASADPADLSVVEAHGTATAVGDRTELESLARLREGSSPHRRSAAVTSVKALIGHTMAAAGIAGIVKAALMARHRIIPGQPGLVTAAHTDSLRRGGLMVPSPAPVVRPDDFGLVGVSSFGFGGTNVHAVLERPPTSTRVASSAAATNTRRSNRAANDRPHLLVFTAESAPLLIEHLESVRSALVADRSAVQPTISGIARTLSSRALAAVRVTVVCRSLSELDASLSVAKEELAAGRTGAVAENIAIGEKDGFVRRTAFVFPGQGSQSPHMQEDLYLRFPAFRDTADRLNARAVEHARTDPLAAVFADDASSEAGIRRLTSTDICQPALAVTGLASAALLGAVGIHPDLALGHSVGELSAAAVTGALSDEEAVELAAIRGRHMESVPADSSGGMVALACDAETARALIEDVVGAWPAAYNDERQTVVSAVPDAIEHILARSDEAGIPARGLQVANGFHSPLLEPIRDALMDDIERFTPRDPQLPLISTVTGDRVRSAAELREHLANNVFEPVRFSAAVESARRSGANVFVQIGGGGALLGSLRRCLPDDEAHVLASSASSPDDAMAFLRLVGRLTALGVDPDLAELVAPGTGGVPLPIAPLPTQRYWVTQPDAPAPSPREKGPHIDNHTVAAPASDERENAPHIADSPRGQSASQPDNLGSLIALMNQQLDVIAAAGLSAPPLTSADSSAPAARLRDHGAETVDRTSISAATDGTRRASSVAEVSQTMRRRAEVESKILAAISQISGHPLELIRAEMSVTDSLGFDSLMVRDLIARISGLWPALPSPAELGERFAERPTVGEIVAYIGATLHPNDRAVPEGSSLPEQPPEVVAPDLIPHDAPTWQYEDTRIESFPEAVALRERRTMTERNPYFHSHEGLISATTTIGDRNLVSFSSYNYLGLSGHPAVAEAISDAVRRYGSSVSASRFLSGERPIHAELEREIAALLGVESALAFVSGHATNVGVIGHLVGPGDLIVHDELAHDSIIQGATLSGATRRSFPHNDMDALDRLLRTIRPGFRRVLIAVEGVYSMDGDLAPLPRLIEVKKTHGAMLLVDEAHSIGTVGERGGGVGEYFDVNRTDVDLWVGTLSKSLSGCGGYVGGTAGTIDYLKYSVPGFVYSVGITPANTAASLAALKVMREEPGRLSLLRRNGDLFRTLAREHGIDVGASSDSPIIPCIVRNSSQTLALSNTLFDAGISVNPILYPAVPEDQARLRFFVTSEHTEEHIERAVTVTADELRRVAGKNEVTE